MISTVWVTTVTGTVDISVMVGVIRTGVGSISPGSAVEHFFLRERIIKIKLSYYA